MPWHIAKSSSCPASKPWAVIKDSDDSVAGCHASEASAKKQLAALYANEEKSMDSIEQQRRAAAEKRRAALCADADPRAARGLHPRLAERSSQHRGTDQGEDRAVLDRYLSFPSELRAKTEERNGKSFVVVEGTASVFNRGYDMWDEFGPYVEDVAPGAADASIAAKPDVVFLLNHRGLAMARTGGPWNGNNSTLEVSADASGLHDTAWLNPERGDVKDLMHAVADKVVTEQSFGFMLNEGEWSEDFATFTITRFDINRGDVSAVNYGANPYTSIAARQQEILTDLRLAGPSMARAALHELLQRPESIIDQEVEQIDAQRQQEEAQAAAEAVGKGRSLVQIEAMLG